MDTVEVFRFRLGFVDLQCKDHPIRVVKFGQPIQFGLFDTISQSMNTFPRW
jgi:hypothetical protein